MARKTYTFSLEDDVVESVRVAAGMVPLSRFIEAILKRELERLGQRGRGASDDCR